MLGPGVHGEFRKTGNPKQEGKVDPLTCTSFSLPCQVLISSELRVSVDLHLSLGCQPTKTNIRKPNLLATRESLRLPAH